MFRDISVLFLIILKTFFGNRKLESIYLKQIYCFNYFHFIASLLSKSITIFQKTLLYSHNIECKWNSFIDFNCSLILQIEKVNDDIIERIGFDLKGYNVLHFVMVSFRVTRRGRSWSVRLCPPLLTGRESSRCGPLTCTWSLMWGIKTAERSYERMNSPLRTMPSVVGRKPPK